MLIFQATARAQLPQQTRSGKIRKDAWGYPQQTIYLDQSKSKRFVNPMRTDIALNQITFYRDLLIAMRAEPDWFKQRGFSGKLPPIANDIASYTIQEIMDDTVQHHANNHDPALSFINRQKYIISELAKHLGPEVKEQYGIDVKFNNPDDPVLDRFKAQLPPEPRHALFDWDL